MNFSDDTVAILKNFSQINQNILFKEGMFIDTISNGRSVYAVANIDEQIPVEFGVYDLPSLISMLGLINEHDIKFLDDRLIIESDKGKFEYFYTSPDIITAPPVGGIQHTPLEEFEMSAADFNLLMKAAAITNSPNICIETANGDVTISAIDRKNDTSNTYKRVVSTSEQSFSVYISVENLSKIMKDSYTVTIAKGKNGKTVLLYLSSLDRRLEYWIACEPGSVA